jgi:hypothetical protein
MRWIPAFGRFWWDFIVGDDWFSAVGIAVAMISTVLVVDAGFNGWMVMPIGSVTVLYLTLRRAIR